MGVSHVVVKEGGHILEGGLDFGKVACRCLKGGVCFGSEVYSGSVAYRCLRERGVDYGSVAYSGEEVGIFWKDGYILGGSHF